MIKWNSAMYNEIALNVEFASIVECTTKLLQLILKWNYTLNKNIDLEYFQRIISLLYLLLEQFPEKNVNMLIFSKVLSCKLIYLYQKTKSLELFFKSLNLWTLLVLTNCLSVFNQFVWLALKGLMSRFNPLAYFHEKLRNSTKNIFEEIQLSKLRAETEANFQRRFEK